MIIKNILNWIGTILQISLTIFAIVIYNLSNKKMGLVRHFTYQNYKWDGINLRFYTTCVLSLLVIAFIVLYYIKYRNASEPRKITSFKINIVFIVLSFIAIAFAVIYNTDKLLTYYVFVLVSIFILLIEFLKLGFFQAEK